MIIDINAYIGNWPFRRLRNNTASGLLKLMDENGIDKAVVSSLNAIFYRNCHAGNEEMSDEIKTHRDRLIPFATLNPEYPGWEDDLKQCREDFGIAGIRLFPHYHNYKLYNNTSLNMIHHAADRGMPVAIPIRMEDRRQRHWLDNVGDISVSDIETAARECPEAKFMILNGRGFENSPLIKDDKLKNSNYLIEISRMSAVLQEEIPKLIELIGVSKLAFGTGMPFNYPAPALLKMQMLDDSMKEDIFWKNSARYLS